MRLVCVHVHLHPETKRVMTELGAEFRWTGDDDYHYHRVLRQLADEGKPVILVEQDLVPTLEQLQELADCPQQVCTVRYAYPCADMTGGVTTGLGVIKLGRRGGEFPKVDWSHRWSVLPEGEFWHWNDIVTQLFGQFPGRHLHQDLMVEHHHDCSTAHPRRVNPNSAL